MNYLIIAIFGFIFFFKDQISEFFRDKDDDPNNYNSIPSKTGGQPFTFSVWTPDSFKVLIQNGYTGTSRSWEWVKSVSDEIKETYGFVVTSDNRVLGALYKIGNQYEFNRLVSAFAGSSPFLQVNQTSLRNYLESELSEESLAKALQFINKLPKGWH